MPARSHRRATTIDGTDSIAAAYTFRIWLYQHMPVMVFLFGFGASAGSFLNVVIHRLPEGRSVLTPPSRCPVCSAGLKWYDNLPILGWFLLRGRCRYCRARIPARYMAIELLMAAVFVGLYAALFLTPPDMAWWGEVGGVWWYRSQIPIAWPSYVALAFLLCGLVAVTIIDARTFLIPLQIPAFVTASAFVLYTIQSLLPESSAVAELWPIPVPPPQWSLAALLAVAGLGLSTLLMWFGVLRPSFADYEEYVEEGETIGDYPHARREMWVELVFLTPCLVGLMAGYWLGEGLDAAATPGLLDGLGAAALGFLVGGGVVWAIRIVFTFLFGREAMGMGDVHLLAAVGAVLGWRDPLWVFFLAPIIALGWMVVAGGVARMLRAERRELPFGPHLAVMTALVIVCRPAVNWAEAYLVEAYQPIM